MDTWAQLRAVVVGAALRAGHVASAAHPGLSPACPGLWVSGWGQTQTLEQMLGCRLGCRRWA